MDTRRVSEEQKQRVLDMQNLLATGIERLILFYFDMLLHGNLVPGSTDITCYICAEFHFNSEPMTWVTKYQGRHFDDDAPSDLYCMRCEFCFTFPCASLRSEELMDTMITLATKDPFWDERSVSEIGAIVGPYTSRLPKKS